MEPLEPERGATGATAHGGGEHVGVGNAGAGPVEEVWCLRCGVHGTTSQDWLLIPRAGRNPYIVCLACGGLRKPPRNQLRTGLLFGLWIAVMLGMLMLFPAHQLPLAFIILGLSVVAQIVLHELGHAIAAKAAGMVVIGFTFGGGPIVVAPHVGRLRLIVRLVPGSAATHVWPGPRSRLSWTALFWFVAGGPATHVVVLAVTAMWQPGSADLRVVRGVVMSTAAMLLIENLLPAVVKAGGVLSGIPNDGMRMRTLFRLPDDWRIAADFGPAELLPLARLGVETDANHRIAALAAVVDRRSDWIEARSELVGVLQIADRHAEAVPHLRLLLADGRVADRTRAGFENVLAWTLLLLGGADEEALRLSGSAAATLPWDLCSIDTYGCALVANGDPAGVPLIERAGTLPEGGLSAAARYAFLAMGEHLRGRPTDAWQALNASHRSFPTCPVTARAHAMLLEGPLCDARIADGPSAPKSHPRSGVVGSKELDVQRDQPSALPGDETSTQPGLGEVDLRARPRHNGRHGS